MSLAFKSDLRIFIHDTALDMRSGFNRLSNFVREAMNAKLVDGDIFVFFGKSRLRLKMILYNGTGVVLITKRLERGQFMSLLDLEEREISSDELNTLLHGGVVRKLKFGEIPLTRDTHLNQFRSLMTPLKLETNVNVLREYAQLATDETLRLQGVVRDLNEIISEMTQSWLEDERSQINLEDQLHRLQKKFFGFGRETLNGKEDRAVGSSNFTASVLKLIIQMQMMNRKQLISASPKR